MQSSLDSSILNFYALPREMNESLTENRPSENTIRIDHTFCPEETDIVELCL
jgi:hypothetical protein